MHAPKTSSSKPTVLRRPADIARFWSRIQKTQRCWLWTGSKDAYGYGRFAIYNGHTRTYRRAPRVAYALTHGEIPAGMEVCHNCPGGDNRACVNPAHLGLGQHGDNVRDCVLKGRARGGVRGERNPGARLTEQQVLDIRRRRQVGERTADLARDYGITSAAVRMIVTRRTWKHI